MAKRKPSKSHLYQRTPGGVWYAWYIDSTGERIRFSTRCTDKTAAAKVLAEAERNDAAQAAAGLGSDAAGKTLEDVTYHLAVDAHTSARGKPIKETTRTMYRQKGGHLGRLLRVCDGCAVGDVDGSLSEACEAKHASIALTKLKRHNVVRYIDQRISEGAARTTIKKDLNTLSVALRLAADRGWCSHALAVECIPPFSAESTPRMRWLTHEEFPLLLGALDTSAQLAKPRANPDKDAKRLVALEARRAGVADRKLFVIVGCLTGAELSALTRLDWTDINFVAMTIRIPGTKNATRDRTIGLDPQLADALRRIPESLRTGRVLRRWVNACHDLAVACARAGIPKVTPHSLRHTFASWLVQAGVDTFRVGKLLGHKDSKMVERYYGHLKPKNLSDSIALLPRFADLFPVVSQIIEVVEAPAEPCVTGVSSPVAVEGVSRPLRVPNDRPAGTAKRRISDEESKKIRVRAEGLEPSTSGLRVRCSTIELCPRAG
jgi:integrase